MVGITEFAVADILEYAKRVIKLLIICIIYNMSNASVSLFSGTLVFNIT